ncbi:hypothetical protein KIPB_012764, partial [Kipferlia bialata]|eukprot:g12764.t1
MAEVFSMRIQAMTEGPSADAPFPDLRTVSNSDFVYYCLERRMGLPALVQRTANDLYEILNRGKAAGEFQLFWVLINDRISSADLSLISRAVHSIFHYPQIS